MKSLQVITLDGPEAMGIRDVPVPVPAPDEVLIEVRSAGLAFPDLLITQGLYQVKMEPPFTPGTEVSGVVVSAPEGHWAKPGDRVASYAHAGGFAEFVVVPGERVFPLTDDITFNEAAAIPINYLTAHLALTLRGRIVPGETVLVHGAGGGLGLACIHLAKALGARVIAVASSQDKRDLALAAGADSAIEVDGFLDATRALTDGQGVDVVVDPVGGDRVTDSLRSLRPLGRLLVLGFTGGDIPQIKVNRLLLNNLDVVGVGWGAFAMTRSDYMREQWDALMVLFAGSDVRPVVTSTTTLEGIPETLLAMGARGLNGKVVAVISE